MHDDHHQADGSSSTTSTTVVPPSSCSLATFESACCDESIASTVERVMRTILKNDSCKSSNTKVLSSTQKRKGLSIAGKAKRVAKGLNDDVDDEDFEFVEFRPIDSMSSSGTQQSCSVGQPTSPVSSRNQQHHCAGTTTAVTTGTCNGNNAANGARDSQRCGARPAATTVVDDIEQPSKTKRRKRDKSEGGKNGDNSGEKQSVTTKVVSCGAPPANETTTGLVKTPKANNKSKCNKRSSSDGDTGDHRNPPDHTDAPKAKKSKRYEKKPNDVVDHSVRGRVEDGNNRDKQEPSSANKCGATAKSSAATKSSPSSASSARSKRQENAKTAGVSLSTAGAKVSNNCSEDKGSSHSATATTSTSTRRIQFLRSNENAIADFELVDVRLQEAYAQGLMNSGGGIGATGNDTAKKSNASKAGTTTTTTTMTTGGTSAATSATSTTGGKPRKPAPSPVVTLALRAIVPRGLMPNETCILYANVHVKPNALCGVELHVYGNGDLHTSYETSLLDGKRGGLTVCLQNLSSSYKNIGVGDIVGYLELRSLDEAMKLSV